MSGLREQFMASGISREDAEREVEANTRFRSTGEGERHSRLQQAAKDAAIEAAQIFGGTNGVKQIIVRDAPRACANCERRTVLTSSRGYDDNPERFADNQKSTMLHEMAHIAEHRLPNLRKAAVRWRTARASGAAYQDKLNETIIPDKFISPYVGRKYPEDNGTEVITMGIQHFRSPEAMYDLYRKDPEHFYLTCCALRQIQSLNRRSR